MIDRRSKPHGRVRPRKSWVTPELPRKNTQGLGRATTSDTESLPVAVDQATTLVVPAEGLPDRPLQDRRARPPERARGDPGQARQPGEEPTGQCRRPLGHGKGEPLPRRHSVGPHSDIPRAGTRIRRATRSPRTAARAAANGPPPDTPRSTARSKASPSRMSLASWAQSAARRSGRRSSQPIRPEGRRIRHGRAGWFVLTLE